MTFLKNIFFSFALLISFNSSAELLLNQTTINGMLDKIQESVSSQDIDKFSMFFTEDSIITFEMPKNMGGISTISKDEYMKMLKLGWSLPEVKLTYEVNNIDINIAKDQKSAVVKSITIETVEMNGEIVMSSTSHEVANIIIFNEAPTINKLYGKIDINL